MRKDHEFVINQKETKFKKEISEIKDNSYLIPKKALEENKYLHFLISYFMGNTPSNEFVNFCNLIYLSNQRTFSIIRNFLPLIPERTLRTINSPEKFYLKSSLTDIQHIPDLISQFHPDASENSPVHMTIGGDAASIKTILESGLSSMYTFMALPLEKSRKTNSIYICPTINGTSSEEIVEKCHTIIYLIEKDNKFVVDFVSTDGDGGF